VGSGIYSSSSTAFSNRAGAATVSTTAATAAADAAMKDIQRQNLAMQNAHEQLQQMHERQQYQQQQLQYQQQHAYEAHHEFMLGMPPVPASATAAVGTIRIAAPLLAPLSTAAPSFLLQNQYESSGNSSTTTLQLSPMGQNSSSSSSASSSNINYMNMTSFPSSALQLPPAPPATSATATATTANSSSGIGTGNSSSVQAVPAEADLVDRLPLAPPPVPTVSDSFGKFKLNLQHQQTAYYNNGSESNGLQPFAAPLSGGSQPLSPLPSPSLDLSGFGGRIANMNFTNLNFGANGSNLQKQQQQQYSNGEQQQQAVRSGN
jgi:hypothetical protein